MTERVYVLAGNIREYEAYIATKRGGAYRYVQGYESVVQCKLGARYVRVGSWAARPDLGAIELELEVHKAEEVPA